MKSFFALLLFAGNSCIAQGWEAEIMAGFTGYRGDLTEHVLSPRSMAPSVGFNIKYNLNDLFLLRGGILYGSVLANDKYNEDAALKNRNLNFRTDILEANLCIEVNLLEPDLFIAYPYLFGGVGVFHFNPYTYDKHGVKTYLQPLGTEGQGMTEFPGRKPYSLTQLCLPFGGGIKIYVNKQCDLIYELAGRYLFTDYFDDVSTTYVSSQKFLDCNKLKTAELAFRQTDVPYPSEGDIRGNPDLKDWYFFSGLKLLIRLGHDR